LLEGLEPFSSCLALHRVGRRLERSAPWTGRCDELLRLGSVTHAFNTNQRFLKLTFQAGGGGVTVQSPSTANLAPPGHYMLFILNANGVPSVASVVKIQ